ncbi:hypothetical protein NDU88_009117 [Pleurodeles waltl]|uniref:Uncharacterized protein n=1 Tax=Pleurodeles waltl TaxID=8319 RepID=A0AAV7RWQ7_PLEWA|nr:hypothetical protein NDU88_009117 [Pleurodeles waltl]
MYNLGQDLQKFHSDQGSSQVPDLIPKTLYPGLPHAGECEAASGGLAFSRTCLGLSLGWAQPSEAGAVDPLVAWTREAGCGQPSATARSTVRHQGRRAWGRCLHQSVILPQPAARRKSGALALGATACGPRRGPGHEEGPQRRWGGLCLPEFDSSDSGPCLLGGGRWLPGVVCRAGGSTPGALPTQSVILLRQGGTVVSRASGPRPVACVVARAREEILTAAGGPVHP